jgi:hypothetical protein
MTTWRTTVLVLSLDVMHSTTITSQSEIMDGAAYAAFVERVRPMLLRALRPATDALVAEGFSVSWRWPDQ